VTESRLVAIDGTDALAFVIIRPGKQDGAVAIEAAARGMSKPAAAYVLRHVADEWEPEVAEAAPDFFQPGHTYAHAHYRFECLHLVTHPVTGEVQAWGWFGKADTDGRRHMSFTRGQWDARPWDDITTGGGR
jgi:hypothetical protein